MAEGTTWRVFRDALCEATLRGSGGMLAVDLSHYGRGDGVCCWSKVENLRLRWNGKRYVTVFDRIVPA